MGNELTDIDKFKESKVNLSEQKFERSSSLFFRLTNIYLILTLINIVFFLGVTGTDKYFLVTENASLTANQLALKIVQRLKPVIDNPIAILALSSNQESIRVPWLRKIHNLLRQPNSETKLILARYAIANIDGDIIYQYPGEWAGKGKIEDKNLVRKLIASNGQKENLAKEFFNDINTSNYKLQSFIPISLSLEKDIVFFTSKTLKNLQAEETKFYILSASIIGIIILIQVIFAFILYRSILVPIRNLVVGAEAVAAEDLSIEVVRGKRDDEFDQLIFTFNLMVKVIAEKTGKLNTTIFELEKNNERIQAELDMARDIQQGILPNMKMLEKINVGVYYAPLEKVSGDYYDLFYLPNDDIGFLIGDVSGHGVPAALITIMAKVHLTSLTPEILKPAELFTRINGELAKAITTDDYMTGFYGILSPDLSFKYVNASHQKIILLRNDANEVELLTAEGFLLGAIDEVVIPYEEKKVQLSPNDRIVFYTDGITEARAPNGDMYTQQRLEEKIIANRHLGCQELTDYIIKDMDEFADGHERNDDITVIIVEIKQQSVEKSKLNHQGRRTI